MAKIDLTKPNPNTPTEGESFNDYMQRLHPQKWKESHQTYNKSQEWKDSYQHYKDIWSGESNKPGYVGPGRYGEGSQQQKAQQPTSETETIDYQQSLNNILQLSGLPQSQQLMIKMVVDAYPENQDINDLEILDTFQKLSTQIVDPYYAELIAWETSEMERYIAQSQASASAAASRARAGASAAIGRASAAYEADVKKQEFEGKRRIEETEAGLEASGLSRTGQRLNLLGKYRLPGEAKMEGIIPEYSRMIAESSRAQYQANVAGYRQSASASASSARLSSQHAIAGYQAGASRSIKGLQETQQRTKGTLLTNLISQQDSAQDYSRLFS